MMDFVKFAHDRNRMCSVKRGAGEGCKGCPLDEIKDKKSVCSVWCFANPEKATEVVEQWAADHPIKTRQSVFLERYPEAAISKDGAIAICPLAISAAYRHGNGACNKGNSDTCADCKRQFWSAEVEE